ncbi:hypothetical protein PHJA_000578500 [Phtheirospermum japonicum]|uniref:DUF7054 domain-containing protein n=1 Tax=Phtheirospermum japonicum TaxID=374723 RepID=A0A830BGV8_9LAMI|nr:hypothetical protein PHJA_000578500 [Phtheirospermum japonicum]
MPLEVTVEDLIAAALRQYAKEQRLLALPSTAASDFDLHYSQFSLQSKIRFDFLNFLKVLMVKILNISFLLIYVLLIGRISVFPHKLFKISEHNFIYSKVEIE